MEIETCVFFISCFAISIQSALGSTYTDFKSIFHTPSSKYDEYEILERSNFQNDAHQHNKQGKYGRGESPQAVANAQVLLHMKDRDHPHPHPHQPMHIYSSGPQYVNLNGGMRPHPPYFQLPPVPRIPPHPQAHPPRNPYTNPYNFINENPNFAHYHTGYETYLFPMQYFNPNYAQKPYYANPDEEIFPGGSRGEPQFINTGYSLGLGSDENQYNFPEEYETFSPIIQGPCKICEIAPLKVTCEDDGNLQTTPPPTEPCDLQTTPLPVETPTTQTTDDNKNQETTTAGVYQTTTEIFEEDDNKPIEITTPPDDKTPPSTTEDYNKNLQTATCESVESLNQKPYEEYESLNQKVTTPYEENVETTTPYEENVETTTPYGENVETTTPCEDDEYLNQQTTPCDEEEDDYLSNQATTPCEDDEITTKEEKGHYMKPITNTPYEDDDDFSYDCEYDESLATYEEGGEAPMHPPVEEVTPNPAPSDYSLEINVPEQEISEEFTIYSDEIPEFPSQPLIEDTSDELYPSSVVDTTIIPTKIPPDTYGVSVPEVPYEDEENLPTEPYEEICEACDEIDQNLPTESSTNDDILPTEDWNSGELKNLRLPSQKSKPHYSNHDNFGTNFHPSSNELTKVLSANSTPKKNVSQKLQSKVSRHDSSHINHFVQKSPTSASSRKPNDLSTKFKPKAARSKHLKSSNNRGKSKVLHPSIPRYASHNSFGQRVDYDKPKSSPVISQKPIPMKVILEESESASKQTNPKTSKMSSHSDGNFVRLNNFDSPKYRPHHTSYRGDVLKASPTLSQESKSLLHTLRDPKSSTSKPVSETTKISKYLSSQKSKPIPPKTREQVLHSQEIISKVFSHSSPSYATGYNVRRSKHHSHHVPKQTYSPITSSDVNKSSVGRQQPSMVGGVPKSQIASQKSKSLSAYSQKLKPVLESSKLSKSSQNPKLILPKQVTKIIQPALSKTSPKNIRRSNPNVGRHNYAQSNNVPKEHRSSTKSPKVAKSSQKSKPLTISRDPKSISQKSKRPSMTSQVSHSVQSQNFSKPKPPSTSSNKSKLQPVTSTEETTCQPHFETQTCTENPQQTTTSTSDHDHIPCDHRETENTFNIPGQPKADVDSKKGCNHHENQPDHHHSQSMRHHDQSPCDSSNQSSQSDSQEAIASSPTTTTSCTPTESYASSSITTDSSCTTPEITITPCHTTENTDLLKLIMPGFTRSQSKTLTDSPPCEDKTDDVTTDTPCERTTEFNQEDFLTSQSQISSCDPVKYSIESYKSKTTNPGKLPKHSQSCEKKTEDLQLESQSTEIPCETTTELNPLNLLKPALKSQDATQSCDLLKSASKAHESTTGKNPTNCENVNEDFQLKSQELPKSNDALCETTTEPNLLHLLTPTCDPLQLKSQSQTTCDPLKSVKESQETESIDSQPCGFDSQELLKTTIASCETASELKLLDLLTPARQPSQSQPVTCDPPKSITKSEITDPCEIQSTDYIHQETRRSNCDSQKSPKTFCESVETPTTQVCDSEVLQGSTNAPFGVTVIPCDGTTTPSEKSCEGANDSKSFETTTQSCDSTEVTESTTEKSCAVENSKLPRTLSNPERSTTTSEHSCDPGFLRTTTEVTCDSEKSTPRTTQKSCDPNNCRITSEHSCDPESSETTTGNPCDTENSTSATETPAKESCDPERSSAAKTACKPEYSRITTCKAERLKTMTEHSCDPSTPADKKSINSRTTDDSCNTERTEPTESSDPARFLTTSTSPCDVKTSCDSTEVIEESTVSPIFNLKDLMRLLVPTFKPCDSGEESDYCDSTIESLDTSEETYETSEEFYDLSETTESSYETSTSSSDYENISEESADYDSEVVLNPSKSSSVKKSCDPDCKTTSKTCDTSMNPVSRDITESPCEKTTNSNDPDRHASAAHSCDEQYKKQSTTKIPETIESCESKQETTTELSASSNYCDPKHETTESLCESTTFTSEELKEIFSTTEPCDATTKSRDNKPITSAKVACGSSATDFNSQEPAVIDSCNSDNQKNRNKSPTEKKSCDPDYVDIITQSSGKSCEGSKVTTVESPCEVSSSANDGVPDQETTTRSPCETTTISSDVDSQESTKVPNIPTAIDACDQPKLISSCEGDRITTTESLSEISRSSNLCNTGETIKPPCKTTTVQEIKTEQITPLKVTCESSTMYEQPSESCDSPATNSQGISTEFDPTVSTFKPCDSQLSEDKATEGDCDITTFPVESLIINKHDCDAKKIHMKNVPTLVTTQPYDSKSCDSSTITSQPQIKKCSSDHSETKPCDSVKSQSNKMLPTRITETYPSNHNGNKQITCKQSTSQPQREISKDLKYSITEIPCQHKDKTKNPPVMTEPLTSQPQTCESPTTETICDDQFTPSNPIAKTVTSQSQPPCELPIKEIACDKQIKGFNPLAMTKTVPSQLQKTVSCDTPKTSFEYDTIHNLPEDAHNLNAPCESKKTSNVYRPIEPCEAGLPLEDDLLDDSVIKTEPCDLENVTESINLEDVDLHSCDSEPTTPKSCDHLQGKSCNGIKIKPCDHPHEKSGDILREHSCDLSQVKSCDPSRVKSIVDVKSCIPSKVKHCGTVDCDSTHVKSCDPPREKSGGTLGVKYCDPPKVKSCDPTLKKSGGTLGVEYCDPPKVESCGPPKVESCDPPRVKSNSTPEAKFCNHPQVKSCNSPRETSNGILKAKSCDSPKDKCCGIFEIKSCDPREISCDTLETKSHDPLQIKSCQPLGRMPQNCDTKEPAACKTNELSEMKNQKSKISSHECETDISSQLCDNKHEPTTKHSCASQEFEGRTESFGNDKLHHQNKLIKAKPSCEEENIAGQEKDHQKPIQACELTESSTIVTPSCKECSQELVPACDTQKPAQSSKSAKTCEEERVICESQKLCDSHKSIQPSYDEKPAVASKTICDPQERIQDCDSHKPIQACTMDITTTFDERKSRKPVKNCDIEKPTEITSHSCEFGDLETKTGSSQDCDSLQQLSETCDIEQHIPCNSVIYDSRKPNQDCDLQETEEREKQLRPHKSEEITTRDIQDCESSQPKPTEVCDTQPTKSSDVKLGEKKRVYCDSETVQEQNQDCVKELDGSQEECFLEEPTAGNVECEEPANYVSSLPCETATISSSEDGNLYITKELIDSCHITNHNQENFDGFKPSGYFVIEEQCTTPLSIPSASQESPSELLAFTTGRPESGLYIIEETCPKSQSSSIESYAITTQRWVDKNPFEEIASTQGTSGWTCVTPGLKEYNAAITLSPEPRYFVFDEPCLESQITSYQIKTEIPSTMEYYQEPFTIRSGETFSIPTKEPPGYYLIKETCTTPSSTSIEELPLNSYPIITKRPSTEITTGLLHEEPFVTTTSSYQKPCPIQIAFPKQFYKQSSTDPLLFTMPYGSITTSNYQEPYTITSYHQEPNKETSSDSSLVIMPFDSVTEPRTRITTFYPSTSSTDSSLIILPYDSTTEPRTRVTTFYPSTSTTIYQPMTDLYSATSTTDPIDSVTTELVTSQNVVDSKPVGHCEQDESSCETKLFGLMKLLRYAMTSTSEPTKTHEEDVFFPTSRFGGLAEEEATCQLEPIADFDDSDDSLLDCDFLTTTELYEPAASAMELEESYQTSESIRSLSSSNLQPAKSSSPVFESLERHQSVEPASSVILGNQQVSKQGNNENHESSKANVAGSENPSSSSIVEAFNGQPLPMSSSPVIKPFGINQSRKFMLLGRYQSPVTNESPKLDSFESWQPSIVGTLPLTSSSPVIPLGNYQLRKSIPFEGYQSSEPSPSVNLKSSKHPLFRDYQTSKSGSLEKYQLSEECQSSKSPPLVVLNVSKHPSLRSYQTSKSRSSDSLERYESSKPSSSSSINPLGNYNSRKFSPSKSSAPVNFQSSNNSPLRSYQPSNSRSSDTLESYQPIIGSRLCDSTTNYVLDTVYGQEDTYSLPPVGVVQTNNNDVKGRYPVSVVDDHPGGVVKTHANYPVSKPVGYGHSVTQVQTNEQKPNQGSLNHPKHHPQKHGLQSPVTQIQINKQKHGHQNPVTQIQVNKQKHVHPSPVTQIQVNKQKHEHPSPVTQVQVNKQKHGHPSPVTQAQVNKQKHGHPSPVTQVQVNKQKHEHPSPVTQIQINKQKHGHSGPASQPQKNTQKHIDSKPETQIQTDKQKYGNTSPMIPIQTNTPKHGPPQSQHYSSPLDIQELKPHKSQNHEEKLGSSVHPSKVTQNHNKQKHGHPGSGTQTQSNDQDHGYKVPVSQDGSIHLISHHKYHPHKGKPGTNSHAQANEQKHGYAAPVTQIQSNKVTSRTPRQSNKEKHGQPGSVTQSQSHETKHGYSTPLTQANDQKDLPQIHVENHGSVVRKQQAPEADSLFDDEADVQIGGRPTSNSSDNVNDGVETDDHEENQTENRSDAPETRESLKQTGASSIGPITRPNPRETRDHLKSSNKPTIGHFIRENASSIGPITRPIPERTRHNQRLYGASNPRRDEENYMHPRQSGSSPIGLNRHVIKGNKHRPTIVFYTGPDAINNPYAFIYPNEEARIEESIGESGGVQPSPQSNFDNPIYTQSVESEPYDVKPKEPVQHMLPVLKPAAVKDGVYMGIPENSRVLQASIGNDLPEKGLDDPAHYREESTPEHPPSEDSAVSEAETPGKYSSAPPAGPLRLKQKPTPSSPILETLYSVEDPYAFVPTGYMKPKISDSWDSEEPVSFYTPKKSNIRPKKPILPPPKLCHACKRHLKKSKNHHAGYSALCDKCKENILNYHKMLKSSSEELESEDEEHSFPSDLDDLNKYNSADSWARVEYLRQKLAKPKDVQTEETGGMNEHRYPQTPDAMVYPQQHVYINPDDLIRRDNNVYRNFPTQGFNPSGFYRPHSPMIHRNGRPCPNCAPYLGELNYFPSNLNRY